MKQSKATEKEYARALKKIAKQAAHIVDLFSDGAIVSNPSRMMEALRNYADLIEPYANTVAARMISKTSAAVERSIKSQSREISRGLNAYLRTASGAEALELQRQQVILIKSLPLEAGQRAQKLAMEAVTGGKRPDVVAAEIARTNEVTESRATLIARTESAKAAAVITEERAKAVGATHYIWRTAGDSDVRESHAEMEGQVCEYDNPPIVDGEPLNPGQIFNCRCYAEIILPD